MKRRTREHQNKLLEITKLFARLKINSSEERVDGICFLLKKAGISEVALPSCANQKNCNG